MVSTPDHDTSPCTQRLIANYFLPHQAERFEQNAFGICPRVFCQGQAVLPCGRVDTPGIDTVKLFCPNCQDIYGPMSTKYQGVDGELSLISNG